MLFRSLGEEPFYFLHRHVTFDHVTLDHGGVAAAQCNGDTVPRPISFRVVYLFRLHTEAVGSQMIDPRAAAASGRALINRHCGRIGILGCAGGEKKRRAKKCCFQEVFHEPTPSPTKNGSLISL